MCKWAVQSKHICGIIYNYKTYSATMNPAMHCSRPILKHSVYCLRAEAVASLIFELYIFKWKGRVFLPQISVRAWDLSLVGYGRYGWWYGGCHWGSPNSNICCVLPKWSYCPPLLSPLPSWLKLSWISCLSRPSKVVSTPFHLVWYHLINYRRDLSFLIWGVLSDHIVLLGRLGGGGVPVQT